MTLYYADTSVVLKLLVEEEHSEAFAAFFDSAPEVRWISSVLLRIEAIRVVTRARPALLPDAKELLAAFDTISITDEIARGAEEEPDRSLRSLDTIHLATARMLGGAVTAFVTYDSRLLGAVADAGIAVLSPR